MTEILATDCEKAWIHTGWEDTKKKRYGWLEYIKRKDEMEKMEEMRQRKVEKIIKSAEGSAGILFKNHKGNDVEERSTDLGEKRKKMRGCWTVVKQKEKNGQTIGNVMRRYRVCRTSHGGTRS